jgi:serine-type D-Ala-D-Ala carboxypeptidase/endopeptidase (penicillin-binding protein 4)
MAASISACATHAQPVSSSPAASAALPAATARPFAGSKAFRVLQADLSTVFGSPVMARSVWGVDIRAAATGELLYSHNGDRLMMPASNMKILTLATAAERLGWDYRFTTVLETTAPVENGVLRGDLIVRGNGDPSINSRGRRAAAVFDEWARALTAVGITTVEGRIIGDDQAFDDEGVGPGWSWDYLEAGYASPIGALQFNENVAALAISPGGAAGEAAIVRLAAGSGLSVTNRATTTTTAADGARPRVGVHRRIDRAELEVSGSIAAGAKPLERTVAVVNPTVFFAQGLKDGLVTRGIAVTGEAVDIDDIAAELSAGAGGARRTLVETRSAPLSEIATVLMKVSQNQYAETFLKASGAKATGLGTTDDGRVAAIETLTAWGVPRDGYVMSDGSGLSRYNYIAPSTITSVLRRMYSDPVHRDAFLATLPIAGTDGTISARMRKTRAAANAQAKTGSIANVRSLSGFVKTQDGETLVFSIIANDFVIPSATVDWMADLAVETLANYTRR